MIRNPSLFLIASAGALLVPGLAAAEGVDPGVFVANNVWMMLCAALVFIMHLGFAMVESGLTRAKNTTNILFKNTFIICCGILTYFVCGFNLMYPGDFNGYLGFAGVGLGAGFDEGANTASYADGGYTYWTDFLFQGNVCGYGCHHRFRCGCRTDQTGFVPDLLDALRRDRLPDCRLLEMGRRLPRRAWVSMISQAPPWCTPSAAGPHSIGVIVPRAPYWKIRQRTASSSPSMVGNSMPLSTAIGVFLLWLGWFGFNGGSVLSADRGSGVSYVLVTTCLAAAAGGHRRHGHLRGFVQKLEA